jgi:DNA helicase-2/ATP-dependent DNA helicase PcrA
MDFLAGLNPQQAEAVRHVNGPLLILAGAGSGKTRVITHRIAHMVVDCGIAPWSILAVTFTNKAAEEMRQRVKKLLEGKVPGDGPTVATFHSFCVRLLRRYGDRLADIRPGFTRNFSIYDDDDQVSIVKSALRKLGIDDKSIQPRTALSVISNWKSAKTSPDEAQAQAKDPVSKTISAIYEHYENALRTANALDFDDLLLECVRLLEHDDQTRLSFNDRVRYLMIDEYQDTNRSQYELMRLLAGNRNNVCVVGDEDQSIYSWRGADIRNILDFERDFPNANVIRLEQNYRSTKCILEAAGAVVANNKARKGKKLWTAGAAGDMLQLYEAMDSENEALWIADMIEKDLRDHPRDRVAVLYRTNSQSRQIEEALRRYGRKYVVVGGFSFYQRAEIKDLLAYLRVLLSPSDNIGLYRIINVPARGIGKSTVEQLDQVATRENMHAWDAIGFLLENHELGARAEAALRAFRDLIVELRLFVDKAPHEILDMVIEKSGYQRVLEMERSDEAETRIANIQELLTAAQEAGERGEGLPEFLDHAALVSDSDAIDEDAKVSLLTIHNAKGLEYPVVFLAGMEEGLFPHKRSLDSEASMEEERRLCYVGMTRAMRKLYVTWARSRRRFGGAPPEPSIASRFLREIPPQSVKKMHSGAGSAREVELYSEQFEVRNSARKNLFTGKTYNSVENIAQFFKDRGVQAPPPPRQAPPASPPPASSNTGRPAAPTAGFRPPQSSPPAAAAANRPPAAPSIARPVASARPPAAAAPPTAGVPAKAKAAPPAPKKSKLSPGSVIHHPTLGRGTIVRKEGEGPDTKLTVSFPGHGLKKLIAKFAGLSDD